MMEYMETLTTNLKSLNICVAFDFPFHLHACMYKELGAFTFDEWLVTESPGPQQTLSLLSCCLNLYLKSDVFTLFLLAILWEKEGEQRVEKRGNGVGLTYETRQRRARVTSRS